MQTDTVHHCSDLILTQACFTCLDHKKQSAPHANPDEVSCMSRARCLPCKSTRCTTHTTAWHKFFSVKASTMPVHMAAILHCTHLRLPCILPTVRLGQIRRCAIKDAGQPYKILFSGAVNCVADGIFQGGLSALQYLHQKTLAGIVRFYPSGQPVIIIFRARYALYLGEVLRYADVVIFS